MSVCYFETIGKEEVIGKSGFWREPWESSSKEASGEDRAAGGRHRGSLG